MRWLFDWLADLFRQIYAAVGDVREEDEGDGDE